MAKFIIYQALPRLFTNYNKTCKFNGTIKENGCGKLNGFTPKVLRTIKDFGATHIWYTGILEHATTSDYTEFGIRKDHPSVVKGNAGSPYAVKDYYDIDPDLAEDVPNRLKEFENLVERTHRAGLKVIIDFIPNHTAREYYSDMKPDGIEDLGENDNPDWGFSPLNNYYYIPHTEFNPTFNIEDYEEFPAKATGNDQFSASPSEFDWYETVKLNYGVNYLEGYQKQFDPIPDTWFKMVDVMFYWAGKGVDGFRVDMAEMVPVEFWNWAISSVKEAFPNVIFIGEVYQYNEYRNFICNGKFDYLYDKVGLYDKLRGILSQGVPAREITNIWQGLNGIADQMLNFLENHDEQRIGSGFFCGDGVYAKPAMIIIATLTNAPILIYAGQELGERGMDMEGFSGVDGKTSIFDYWGVSSLQAWANDGKFDGAGLTKEQKELQNFYKSLLHISTGEKAITEGKMYDLVYANFGNHYFNTDEQFAFMRKYEDEILFCVVNFQDKAMDLMVNVPAEAFQYLDIKEDEYYGAVNLLNDKEDFPVQKLSSQNPYRVFLPSWDGKILKLKKEKVYQS